MADRGMAIVTGANSGVGFETTCRVADAGWEVVMVCRSGERAEEARRRVLERTETAVDEASLPIELCDLSAFDQVRELSDRLKRRLAGRDGGRPLVLVNNAGLYRAEREITVDGYERTLQVNHLSHFLLTLLLEKELRRAGARVVNVSSAGHRGGKLHKDPLEDIFRGNVDYNGWRAYGDSKQANVLFTRELDRRWSDDGTATFAVHPGVLSTAIWDRNRTFGMFVAKLMKPLMGDPSDGGEAVARLVLDPDVDDYSGSYYKKLEWEQPAPNARDPEFAGRLWAESCRAVGLDDRV